MRKDIAIISSSENMTDSLKLVIESLGFTAHSFKSLEIASTSPEISTSYLALIDLDSVKPDSSSLKKLRKLFVNLEIIGLSTQNYHPELREAIRDSVFTSLIKPPYEDELIYWIKSLINQISVKDAGDDRKESLS